MTLRRAHTLARLSPLTPREQEISSLLTNTLLNKRSIAAELVPSEGTVETHVCNILTRLNLSNRYEIAAWTLRHVPALQGNRLWHARWLRRPGTTGASSSRSADRHTTPNFAQVHSFIVRLTRLSAPRRLVCRLA